MASFEGIHTRLGAAKDTFGENTTISSFYTEYTFKLRHPMLIYAVFQSGIIFAALVAGIVCLINLICVTGTRCKNFIVLLTPLVVGFLHLLTCVTFLKISEESAVHEVTRGGHQHCVDYFLFTTISNIVVLATIALCIIEQNLSSRLLKVLGKLSFLTCIGFGVYMLYGEFHKGNNRLHQEVFFSYDTTNTTTLDFFWSVCLRSISEARYRLFIEYVFIYLPVITVVLTAWITSCIQSKDCSLLHLRIIAPDCFEADEGDDDPDFEESKEHSLKIKCVCTRLNSAYVAILIYCAIVLVILRPAMIVHGYVTSGSIRDLLPSLLHTVIYCFLCSEFLLRMYRQKSYRIRKQLNFFSPVIKV